MSVSSPVHVSKPFYGRQPRTEGGNGRKNGGKRKALTPNRFASVVDASLGERLSIILITGKSGSKKNPRSKSQMDYNRPSISRER